MNKNKLLRAVQYAIGGSVLASSVVALPALSEESSAEVERIEVTGSRIKRHDLEKSAPVSIVDAAQIEISGVENVADLINRLPAITGITNTTQAGSATSSINLRGLPGTATLVLINGQRAANNASDGETVDINSIPPSAIARIEVLKDGASAIYGSDAVAGVVNIILKERYDGFSVDVNKSVSEEDGGDSTSMNLLFGGASDKGSFVIGANIYKQDAVYSRDRDATRVTPRLSSAIPSGLAAISGYKTNDDGSVVFTGNEEDASTVTRINSATDLSGYSSKFDLYNYQQVTSEVPDNKRFSIYGSGTYELSDELIVKGEFIHSDTEVFETWAYAPIFSALEVGDVSWKATSQYNIFGQDVADWRRRMTDSGEPRFFAHDTQFDRIVLSLQGSFNDNWQWSAKALGSQSRYHQIYVNVINKERLKLAVGDKDVCAQIEGCVQMDPLAPAGAMNEEQWRYVLTDVQMAGKANVESYHFDVNGDLFELSAGAVGFAAGVEFRNERFDKQPDGLIENFGTIGGVNLKATEGSRDVSEAYAEALIPVTENFDINLALRYSDFSDFGDTLNPKIGFDFNPVESVKLRATYSTGFRAPSLQELYLGDSEAFDWLTDPCSADNAGSTPATQGCVTQSDPNILQFLTITAGNSAKLEAEESESFTAGVVWSPAVDNDFNIRLDYFSITLENAIDNPKQYFIDKNAAGDTELGNRVIRSANGNINRVDVTYLNLSEREVSGFDLGINYALDTSIGGFNFGAELSWYEKYNDQAHPEAEVIDRVGTYDNGSNAGLLPEYKLSGFVTWKQDDLTIDLRTQWMDEVEDLAKADTMIDSYTRFDVTAAYKYQENWTFSMGVDNLLDEEPPHISTVPSGIEGNTYDVTGRSVFFKVKYEL
ncbi:TonB-dependent receptor [Pseudoalteromonas sp. DL2-H2.2]|uniref:TonB-dependent receptor n=1 Tax=Pseudoalteromonas sp. DL2-H2.2 TaxID=2908889 RepID=UPI001F28FC69|nr:TonB-dependent receptor [Pseudoalteromonas sp. DL2-H2.2]MCF2908773.1 TonB-dependent receptor [Pseudoalteromonas sp. DL2-H2.2]